ncbi:MAG: lamin tail domain-containing protein, partial [Verrucomicrobiales bacterium]
AYLNGTQIAASNAPGAPAWNAVATQTNDDGAAVNFEEFNATASIGALRPGTNILAIHALNESTGSSDFLNQARIAVGFDEGGGIEVGGIEYAGEITLTQTARLFARVFDPSGGYSTNSGQTPVGTGWGPPLLVEYLVDEVPADSSNLAISEVMFDPYRLGDALTASGEFEWLELQNISAGRVSLTGCSFSGGIGFDFPGLSLAPGGRILLVKNQLAFEQVYGTGRSALIAGTFSGSLDNDGEILELRGADGAVVQSIAYDGGDARRGYSIVAGGDGTVWSEGRSLLGSPGVAEPSDLEVPDIYVNEIVTNSVLPELDAIELHNPSGAAVDVGGWFLSDDLGIPEKFRIPEGTVIAAGGYLVFSESDFNPQPGVGSSFALASGGEEVYLIAATPSGERLDYVSGFEFGAASAGVSFGRHVTSVGEVQFPPMSSTSFGSVNPAPRVGPIVVSELQYNPAPGGSEFIEILNVSGSPVPLEGIEVGGVAFVFGADAPELAPGEVALLVEFEPAAFRETYSPPAGAEIFGPYSGRLDNGGELVEFRMPEPSQAAGDPPLMVAVERIRFSDSSPWPPEADGGGFTLLRRSPTSYGNDPASWEVSQEIGGTPGLAGDPPADWREQFFSPEEIANPQISGPNADADLDGASNLAEFLMGTDLRDAGSRAQVQVTAVEEETGVYLELRHLRRNGVDEFFIDYEISDDLSSWGSAGGFMEEREVLDQGDGTSLVTARSTVDIGSLGVDARYVRLHFREVGE